MLLLIIATVSCKLLSSFYIFSPPSAHYPYSSAAISTMFEYGYEIAQRGISSQLLTSACDSTHTYIYSQGSTPMISAAQYFAQGACYSKEDISIDDKLKQRSKPLFGNVTELRVPNFILNDIPVFSISERNYSIFSDLGDPNYEYKLLNEIADYIQMVVYNKNRMYRMKSKDMVLSDITLFTYFCDAARFNKYCKTLIGDRNMEYGDFIAISIYSGAEGNIATLEINDAVNKQMNLNELMRLLRNM